MSPSLFQFTPLREGRRKGKIIRVVYPVFQFTPLREGRPKGFPPCPASLRFQFTPLREGRPGIICWEGLEVHISIHAPARGATFAALQAAAYSIDFNSRPCERGDLLEEDQMIGWERISIHAPARGATFGTLHPIIGVGISIHAPARGATKTSFVRERTVKFQFTPLREGRPSTEQPTLSNEPISIHAPARGATKITPSFPGTQLDFNSRPCERGDLAALSYVRQWTKFQFTPLREGRQNTPVQACAWNIFQFTPLREGRRLRLRIPVWPKDFNSRPCERGDQAVREGASSG